MKAPHGGEPYNINTTFLYYLPIESNLIRATLCLIVTFKLNIPKGEERGGGLSDSSNSDRHMDQIIQFLDLLIHVVVHILIA